MALSQTISVFLFSVLSGLTTVKTCEESGKRTENAVNINCHFHYANFGSSCEQYFKQKSQRDKCHAGNMA